MTKTDDKNNGFDILRYYAAFSVMMLHYTGYSLMLSEQAAGIMVKVRYVTTLFPGVVILFSMSGFLVSSSFERTKTRKEFFRRRVLRMYPELWVCTLVNLLVVCLLVPTLLDKSILMWLGTQIFGIANTPSCLKSFATGSVNGALWTIFTEVQLYVVLGIVYPVLKKKKTGFWIVFLIMLALANLVCGAVAEASGGVVAKLIERIFLPYALWFFIGVFCYQKRDKVLPVLKKAFRPLIVFYVAVSFIPVSLPGYYVNILISVLLPFLVIGGAYCLPKLRFRCDLTYGMFLYHWIVLNVIVHFDLMNRLPWYLALLLFVTATLSAAWLSWKFVRGNKILKERGTHSGKNI